MIKKLLTTFAVLTLMTAFAMAQGEPIINSGTITNKGKIVVGCKVDGESILNEATGVIANNATGVIQFTGDDPLFYHTTGGAGSVTNNGTIQFDGNITQDVMTGLGTTRATRIGGIVKYNGTVETTDDQTIQGGIYYTNLTLAGAGLKTFDDTEVNYYVSAEYTASGGTRAYGSSIFHYDGDAAQDIFAESGAFGGSTNYYNNLRFEGDGVKTILEDGIVHVADEFNDADTTAVTMAEASQLIFKEGITANVAGDITGTGATIQLLGSGAATGTFDVAATGSITFEAGTAASLFEMDGATVTNAGAMTFEAGKYDQLSGHSIHSGTITLTGGDYVQTAGLIDISGTMTVTTGTFDINGNTSADSVKIAVGGLLALTAETGIINMAHNTNLLVNGAFTNASATPTNLIFISATDTSTVTYNDGGEILVTSLANSFGNLKLQKTEKNPLGDIYVGRNFSLDGADLNMNQTGAGNATVSTLFIKKPKANNVVYGAGLITDMEQVIGKMNRVMTGAGNSDVLVFNNNATTITMTTDGLTDLTLNVTPDATGYGDYKATEDIMRSIAFDYNQSAGTWQVAMAYGYKIGELPGTQAANFSEALLRYREVLTDQDEPNPGDPGTSEKVATGSDPLRSPSVASPEAWGRVTLAGINSPTLTLATVADNAELFLRGTPTTFYTIAAGRWSNPATWDEGRQPSYLDNTEILHTVHVGFAGGADRNVNPGGRNDERDGNLAGGNKLAQSILITNADGASLIFGNPSITPEYLAAGGQAWEMNTAGIITNQNTNNNTETLTTLGADELDTFVTGGNVKYQGLIIFGDDDATSLSTTQLINAASADVMVGPNTILQICQTP